MKTIGKKTFFFLVAIVALPVTMLTLIFSQGIGAERVKADSWPFLENEAFSIQDESSGAPDCRVGVTVQGPEQIEWVDAFDAGWHLNFGVYAEKAINGAEAVPVISVMQDKVGSQYLDSYQVSIPLTDNGLGAQIDANPGTLWIVGNEPDRGPDPGSLVRKQDDTFPDVYARAYHEVYHYIKDRDPTAQVGNAGLVGVTPGRLQYLDLVWQAYWEEFREPMPVDVWTMHLYIL